MSAHRARSAAVAAWPSIFITHNVIHAMTVGDHFAVLIEGEKAADFRKGEKTREEITDLMAGGEAMAELEAEIEAHSSANSGQPIADLTGRRTDTTRQRHRLAALAEWGCYVTTIHG